MVEVKFCRYKKNICTCTHPDKHHEGSFFHQFLFKLFRIIHVCSFDEGDESQCPLFKEISSPPPSPPQNPK